MKEKVKFITGNEAVILGAKTAGATFMSGYPITPATEILQLWAEECEKYKSLKMIQSEDETSAGFNVIGALFAGEKAFTASAGPGHILMQDALSMAEAMRLPFVGVMIMRGGPSTGTVIYGQQEITLACFGGNGEGHRIVYSAANPQELFDLTYKAFDSAWHYRFPTIVLGDGYQSKMMSKILIKDNYKKILSKPLIDKNINLRNCFNIEAELAQNLVKNDNDYKKNIPRLVMSEQYQTKDAKKIIVAHGIVSLAAKEAVDILRERGQKVGLFRPITLRPLDFVTLSRLAANVEELLIVESSLGHLERLIKSELYGLTKIKTLQKPVQIIFPYEIINKL